MSKILYLIPGFTESAKEERYSEITLFFKQKKFKIVPVEIRWKHRLMSDYVKEFFGQFTHHSVKDDIYLFGFSYGAMISYIVSAETEIKSQFLCSLSPFFSEDLSKTRSWWKKLTGKKRLKEFENLKFNNLAQKVKCKTYLFAGTKEGPEVINRAKIANKKIHNSQLNFVDGGRHDVSQKIYIKKIKEILTNINI